MWDRSLEAELRWLIRWEFFRSKCKAKKKYATESTALMRIGGMLDNRRTGKTAARLSAYQCNYCGFWHLTSHARRPALDAQGPACGDHDAGQEQEHACAL